MTAKWRVPDRIKRIGITTLVAVILLATGVTIGRYDILGLSRAIGAAKLAAKDAKMFFIGEDAFVKSTLEPHYKKPTVALATVAPRSIDTSRLPLKLTSLSLTAGGNFASSSDFVGGTIANVENNIVVMDKLGNIFRVVQQNLEKLDYGTFPSRLKESITSVADALPASAVRALYIAYDSRSSTIYVSLQRFNVATRHVRFNVSSIVIDRTTLGKVTDWRTVFETEDIPDDASFRGATGGKLVVSGNKLYFTVGDYNFGQVPKSEFEHVAQLKTSSFGKVYEHNLTTGTTRAKSIGHRNPQGLVHTKEGHLIDTEHGPEGGDELNIIADGGNYGWPYKTYGTDYGTFTWPAKAPTSGATFSDPLFAWVPSIAVSPIIQIDSFFEDWNGDLLVGSLKAQSLFRLKIKGDRVIFSEPIWIGHRIRDIAQLDHQIVLITDDPSLIFVSIDEARLKANQKFQKNVEQTPALAGCLGCHHFGETNPSHLAPTLVGIMNKRIATDNFDRYSVALKGKGGVWDDRSLARFIRDPNEFAPGSGMPRLGLSEEQISQVIKVLGSKPQK